MEIQDAKERMIMMKGFFGGLVSARMMELEGKRSPENWYSVAHIDIEKPPGKPGGFLLPCGSRRRLSLPFAEGKEKAPALKSVDIGKQAETQ